MLLPSILILISKTGTGKIYPALKGVFTFFHKQNREVHKVEV